LPAWNFSDEVLRWILHGNSLLLLRRTCSSHLSVLMRRRLRNLLIQNSYSALTCQKRDLWKRLSM
jgi:hypothetical protein